MPDFRPVSKSRPCPVCGGDHKCSTTPDGLLLCGRKTGHQDGFRCLGPCRRNPVWTMYRLVDGSEPRTDRIRANLAARPFRRADPFRSAAHVPEPAHVPPPPSLRDRAEALAGNLTPLRAADLAQRLNLPAAALGYMPLLGYDPDQHCWTFPEVDGDGRVVGLLCRYPDGTKRRARDGRAGLSLVGGWADLPGPVFLVEGPTDALALAKAGLAAVGRPSNRGGVAHLAALLKPLDPARPLVVVGENDRKADGTWPGKEGAGQVAAELAAAVGRAVRVTLPPEAYKDCRDWVADRWAGGGEGFDWHALGREVAAELVADAVEVRPPDPKGGPDPHGRRWPLPVPVTELALPGPGGVSWVWDGFLARDAVTLLSALPKCGKTTLLAHLLAALPAGGSFCGRALAPGRAVVVSEEPTGVWAGRCKEVGMAPPVRVIARGRLPRCGTLDDWTAFVNHLAGVLDGDPADLVVFDTLANLWPVRDENSAAEVGAALAPLHALTAGRAVLVVHHLRKSDGEQGTGSRGSGALAGFVDVMVELRRQKPSLDPPQRRRVLTGYGRYDGIPDEWVVELRSAGGEYDCPRFAHVPDKGGEGAKGAAADARADRLRAAIKAVLADHGLDRGLTRKELWERLPDDERRNEPNFREVLGDGVGVEWGMEPRANNKGGPLYRPIPF